MSTFHKPRVFRSTEGCCICRAKSSSSRFTCSSRYSDQFGSCFQLSEERGGEICNACVLLVKRWRKLPPYSRRHWGHMVDARAGPGGRSYLRHTRKPPTAVGDREIETGLYKIRRKPTKKQRHTEVTEVESGHARAARLLQEEPLSSFIASSYWERVHCNCECLVLEGGDGERVLAHRKCSYGSFGSRSSNITSMESLIEAELAALACREDKVKEGSLDEGFSTGSSSSSSSTVDSRSTYSPDSLTVEEEP